MTNPSAGGGPFQIGDDFVALRVSMQVDDAGVTGLRSLVQDLTHEQLHRVAVASGRLRTLVLVLGYCGLRFGEAASLRVADVDVGARRIRVRRSITYVQKNRTRGGPDEKPHRAHGAGAGVRRPADSDRDSRPRR